MADPIKGATAPESKRVEETHAKRRRREEFHDEYRGPLSVNEALLDHSKFAYRWINDEGNRIHNLTVRDDWDKVTDPTIKDDANNLGAEVRMDVGTHKDGQPKFAYLCRKPLDLWREDRAKKSRRTKEVEEALMRGSHKDANALSTDQPTTYVPGTNTMDAKAGTRVTNYKP